MTSDPSAIETILREWLEDPAITIACGDWQHGTIMEIIPEGRARLTPARYPAPFSGLRDLVLAGEHHHLHLDLEKLAGVLYTVTPSVCYGYRPSFEVRFLSRRSARKPLPALAVMVQRPYRGAQIERGAVVSYFRRLLDHQGRFPGLVRVRVEGQRGGTSQGWGEVLECFREARGEPSPSLAEAPDPLRELTRALSRRTEEVASA